MGQPIEGYVTCGGCGSPWLLKEIATRTGGVCSECFMAGTSIGRIQVIADGIAMTMAAKRFHRRRKNRGNTETKHKAEHARRRAKTRLAKLFPDLYDQILAEERGKLGLEPWPVELAVRAGDDPDGSKTLDALEMYGQPG